MVCTKKRGSSDCACVASHDILQLEGSNCVAESQWRKDGSMRIEFNLVDGGEAAKSWESYEKIVKLNKKLMQVQETKKKVEETVKKSNNWAQ